MGIYSALESKNYNNGHWILRPHEGSSRVKYSIDFLANGTLALETYLRGIVLLSSPD